MAGQRLKLDDTVAIGGLVSKAIVAPVRPQRGGGTESPSEIDPSRDKDRRCASVCV